MGRRPARPAFEPGIPWAESTSLRLPDSLRESLARPYGPVFSPEELPAQTSGSKTLAAIGDVTAGEAIRRGLKPHFIVVDFKTKRGPVAPDDVVRSYGQRVKRVASPPAVLTAALYNAVLDAARARRKTRIEVDGEEDLAVLPAIMHLEAGATVIYGMPDRGVAAVRVDAKSRRLARQFLEFFELISV